MRWDPSQYGRYDDERGRPFVDLIARIGANAPRRIVDLGCGPGNLTTLLADRWPDALIDGIDSSADMIESATSRATAQLRFQLGNINSWHPAGDVDVVVSNAALQWVPGHDALLRRWADELPADSWLAWQVPANFEAPSHVLMRELAESPRWSERLTGVLRHSDAVSEPAEYAALLLAAGWSADVWETTYLHILQGADPVLEWVRGTGLRPVLAALSSAERRDFEVEFAAALRQAYPAAEQGTIFSFRRIFAVGHKR